MIQSLLYSLTDYAAINLHRAKSIAYINKRLDSEGTNNSQPLSDGVVVAVAMLVNVEVRASPQRVIFTRNLLTPLQTLTGSYQAASAHMSGLRRMVDLRGGLDAMEHSVLLQRVVTWCVSLSCLFN